MSTVALCRVCLASNTKMHHIANTPYQDIFEKLATQLCMDGRPETVCWVCLSALKRGRRLADTARAAHEILTQLSLSGIQLNEDTVSILDRTFVRKLAWTPIQNLSVNEQYKHCPTKVEIKQEPSENDLRYFVLCDETQVFNQTQAMNKSQVQLMLTHTEMDFAQEKQTGSQEKHTGAQERYTVSQEKHTGAQERYTGSQEKHTGCQTIFNIKQEQSSYEEISQPNCSESILSETQTGKTQLADAENRTKESIGKKERCNKVGMSADGMREPADIKQEMVDIPTEFEVEFTHIPEETPQSKLKKPKRSYETLVLDRDGLARVKHGCPHCENTYRHRCHLLRHIRMHNEEPPRNFCCEICGKAFHTKSILKKHRLYHSEEKKFSCDHCPTKCSQKIDIERHMTIHTGQKPYQCDICKLKFNRKSNMVLHILTHTDNKPFTCHICNMTFSRKYDLNRHIKRKHVCDKPYACGLCEFRSGNSSYMKTHMAKMHLKGKGKKKL